MPRKDAADLDERSPKLLKLYIVTRSDRQENDLRNGSIMARKSHRASAQTSDAKEQCAWQYAANVDLIEKDGNGKPLASLAKDQLRKEKTGPKNWATLRGANSQSARLEPSLCMTPSDASGFC